ncbi:MAG: hypothetical protein M1823_004341 [Watsoniomyces obsoletus]|nr:MAG: hypothetical protein M1823_004341 [Watsoniomyces obsoletus]
MSRARTWAKMAVAGITLCVGGPAFVFWVTPTSEELFQKFNPELQKRNLEMREIRLERHQHFLDKLKEYSKSDKPIWVVAAEAEKEEKRRAEEERLRYVNAKKAKMEAQMAASAAAAATTEKVDDAQRVAAVDGEGKIVDESSPSSKKKLRDR